MTSMYRTTMVIPTDALPVKVEQRRVVRRALNLRVDLFDDRGVVHPSAATDFSLGGMFLRADPSLFQVKDIIHPAFCLSFDGLYKHCQIVVQVVRVGADGFGVAFYKHDSSLFRYIQKIMYELHPVYKKSA